MDAGISFLEDSVYQETVLEEVTFGEWLLMSPNPLNYQFKVNYLIINHMDR